MPGELPFFVKGYVAVLLHSMALVKTKTGYIYELFPDTEGLEFNKIVLDDIVECEVTSRLTRVLSASIIQQ